MRKFYFRKVKMITNKKYSTLSENILVIIVSFSFICSLSYLFLNAIRLPLNEKIILVIIPWIIFSFLIIVIARLASFSYSILLKPDRRLLVFLFISLILSSIFFFTNKDRIPSWNSLKIEYTSDLKNPQITGDLQILEIAEVLPDGSLSIIPGYKVTTTGGCSSLKDHFICKAGKTGAIDFQAFSSNSISLLLESSKTGPNFKAIFGNETSEISTFKSDDDLFRYVLKYHFSWNTQSLFRKFELLLVFCSVVITLAVVLLAFFVLFSNARDVIKLIQKNREILFSILFLQTLFFTNLYFFQNYQKFDLYKLQRTSGNTLIDLDNTSHSNIWNLQVYLNLYKYFQNRDLIITQPQIEEFRISPETLKELSRFSAIKISDYHSSLGEKELNSVKNRLSLTIPPTGRIKYTYILLIDQTSEKNPICTWDYGDTLYFIPQNEILNCQN